MSWRVSAGDVPPRAPNPKRGRSGDGDNHAAADQPPPRHPVLEAATATTPLRAAPGVMQYVGWVELMGNDGPKLQAFQLVEFMKNGSLALTPTGGPPVDNAGAVALAPADGRPVHDAGAVSLAPEGGRPVHDAGAVSLAPEGGRAAGAAGVDWLPPRPVIPGAALSANEKATCAWYDLFRLMHPRLSVGRIRPYQAIVVLLEVVFDEKGIPSLVVALPFAKSNPHSLTRRETTKTIPLDPVFVKFGDLLPFWGPPPSAGTPVTKDYLDDDNVADDAWAAAGIEKVYKKHAKKGTDDELLLWVIGRPIVGQFLGVVYNWPWCGRWHAPRDGKAPEPVNPTTCVAVRVPWGALHDKLGGRTTVNNGETVPYGIFRADCVKVINTAFRNLLLAHKWNEAAAREDGLKAGLVFVVEGEEGAGEEKEEEAEDEDDGGGTEEDEAERGDGGGGCGGAGAGGRGRAGPPAKKGKKG